MALDGGISQEVLRDPVSLSNDDSQNDGQERVAAEEQSSCPAPKSNSLYGTKDYWEERFSTETDYEWLLSYKQLASQLTPFLQQPIPRILVIGCGNAPFSADMYDAGYHNIVNIDYSEVVISAMKERHCVERPTMEWRVMDMTDLSELADETFDVVIDKAAMDAMMAVEGDVWNPSQICVDQAQSICQHVSRILVPGGHFLQISLAQTHFRKVYLLGWHANSNVDRSDDSYSDEFGWSFRADTANKDSPADCFGHFLYVMAKTGRKSV